MVVKNIDSSHVKTSQRPACKIHSETGELTKNSNSRQDIDSTLRQDSFDKDLFSSKEEEEREIREYCALVIKRHGFGKTIQPGASAAWNDELKNKLHAQYLELEETRKDEWKNAHKIEKIISGRYEEVVMENKRKTASQGPCNQTKPNSLSS